jgi:hypothetical protein
MFASLAKATPVPPDHTLALAIQPDGGQAGVSSARREPSHHQRTHLEDSVMMSVIWDFIIYYLSAAPPARQFCWPVSWADHSNEPTEETAWRPTKDERRPSDIEPRSVFVLDGRPL